VLVESVEVGIDVAVPSVTGADGEGVIRLICLEKLVLRYIFGQRLV
jgi:hypothetical protein